MARPAAAQLHESAPADTLAKPTAKRVLYVLDTTAMPDTIENGAIVSGSRTHEQAVDGVIKQFTFKVGVPMELAPEIALKFLKHDAFKLTDASGNVQPFRRRPRQPGELQAGERLELADDQTVALYVELSTPALQHRALEMPGGEQFAGDKPNRNAIIEFIVARTKTVKKANLSKEPELGEDDFLPPPDALIDNAA